MERRKRELQGQMASQVRLTRNELAGMGAAFPGGAASGERYPAAMMSLINR